MGAETFTIQTPDRSFIHSFTPLTLLLHPLCASPGAGSWGGRNERDRTIGSGDWSRGVTTGRPLSLGLEDRRPAGKG